MKNAFFLSFISNIFIIIDFLKILLVKEMKEVSILNTGIWHSTILLYGLLYYTFSVFYHVLLYRTISKIAKVSYLVWVTVPLIIFNLLKHTLSLPLIINLFNLILEGLIILAFVQNVVVYFRIKNKPKRWVLLIFLILDVLIITVMSLTYTGVFSRVTGQDTYYEYFVYILFNIINSYLIIRYFGKRQTAHSRYVQYMHVFDKTPSSQILSKREKEIVGFIHQGLSNKEIADKLFINENTVKTHVYHVFQKLHVRNRVELVNQISMKKG